MRLMRLWRNSYATPLRLGGGAAFSLAIHGAVIAAWIVATLPPASMSEESIANHAYYIPPKDRVHGGLPVRETVHYIDLSKLLMQAGAHVRIAGNDTPEPAPTSLRAAHGIDPDSVVTVPPPAGHDSVFTVVEVDSAATVAANSAAPVFPLSMLLKHIPGAVSAQYIVDTTGTADTTSFTVLAATTPEFAAAVRSALPYMRFRPAKIGKQLVRQLVQQQFSFRIAVDTVDTAATRAVAARQPPRR